MAEVTSVEKSQPNLQIEPEKASLIQQKYEELSSYIVGLLVKYPGKRIEELVEWAEFRRKRGEIREIVDSVRGLAMAAGAYDRYAAWLLNGPLSWANNITAVSHYLVADCVQSYQSMFSSEPPTESAPPQST